MTPQERTTADVALAWRVIRWMHLHGWAGVMPRRQRGRPPKVPRVVKYLPQWAAFGRYLRTHIERMAKAGASPFTIRKER